MWLQFAPETYGDLTDQEAFDIMHGIVEACEGQVASFSHAAPHGFRWTWTMIPILPPGGEPACQPRRHGGTEAA